VTVHIPTREWGIRLADHPDELRLQVRQILDDPSNIDDPQERRRLAAKAFEMAQQAEALERVHQKAAVDSNVQHNRTAERDRNQRRTYRQQLIREERLYGLRQERVERLQRLLSECNERLMRLEESHRRHRLEGCSSEAEKLLAENFVDMQNLLRDSLREALATQDRIF
jgi:hypothetical protein